jgi:outer membrane protein OmpA-like peptidoglycan-associated protein
VADQLNPEVPPQQYAVERLAFGALASGAPNRDTPFDVALRPDRYSEFVIKGRIRPLASPIRLDAEGHLHGFGLPSVNGLVANDLGHRFLEGQLDDDFHIRVEAGRLEMGNALNIAGLTVEEIPGKEGPPLGAAIALLEDRNGNIKLEVPVSGDLNDPQFRVLGALNPIIMKAVAGTAALAIQPLGSVLLVGGVLANQALKVSFEPALFAAGSAELDQTAKRYLGLLAAKLAEKPKLALRVCGVAVDGERKRDKKGGYLDTEADMLALAQTRADAVRSHLADEGAAARQLRACRPTLDPTEAARPRVDIRF